MAYKLERFQSNDDQTGKTPSGVKTPTELSSPGHERKGAAKPAETPSFLEFNGDLSATKPSDQKASPGGMRLEPMRKDSDHIEFSHPVPPKGTESKTEAPPRPIEHDPREGKYTVRELHGLQHRSHGGNGADAVVVMPEKFDPSKPINLVVYNHGWYDSASSSTKNARLAEQMKNAPPNTVLIVPEWQLAPGTHGKGASNQGRFGNENFAAGMIQDVFNHTPELKGKTLADVKQVGIVSHSAGFVATESELYHNPELAKKVISVTMLDSLYDGPGLNKWLHENIADLSAGRKHYVNIYNRTTRANSEAQAAYVARELRQYRGAGAADAETIDRSGNPPSVAQLRKHPIVFKSTTMDHFEIPKVYLGVVEEASH